MNQEVSKIVQGVLTGAIRRLQLIRLPVRDQVFVAVALILARRSEFLATDGSLIRKYEAVLSDILFHGETNDGQKNVISSTSALKGTSAFHKLHRSEGDKTYLNPPDELKMLVAQHGNNSAIEQFFEDAAAAAREERFRQLSASTRVGRSSHWSILVAQIEEGFGISGLLAMRAAIAARLNGIFEETNELCEGSDEG